MKIKRKQLRWAIWALNNARHRLPMPGDTHHHEAMDEKLEQTFCALELTYPGWRTACLADLGVTYNGEADDVALPDFDLLRKFVDGSGGRRTGDLIRRGWVRIEVTDLGLRALHEHALGDEEPDDV